MALTTAANYKAAVGITDAGRDTQIAAVLTLVEARIAKFCNRIFEKPGEAVTEYFDGDGLSSVIFPKYFPLASVTSLHDDTDRGYGDAYLISSADYVLYNGYIELDGLVFAKGLKNIKLVYLGGYVTGDGETVPNDLKLAVYETINWNMDRLGKMAMLSQAVAQQNFSTQFVVELPPDITSLLAPYRRPAFGA